MGFLSFNTRASLSPTMGTDAAIALATASAATTLAWLMYGDCIIDAVRYWRFARRLKTSVSKPHRFIAFEMLSEGYDVDELPTANCIEDDFDVSVRNSEYFDPDLNHGSGILTYRDLADASERSVTPKNLLPGQLRQQPLLSFGSYSALSLASDMTIAEEAMEMIQTSGLHACHGTPLLYRPPLLIEYERQIAAFVGKEAAVVCSSGFMAVQAALTGLLNPSCYFVSDAEIHLCARQGATLSRAKKFIFPHNDLDRAERILRRIRAKDPTARIALVLESVYSMSGTVLDLRRVADLKQRYGNILLCIDESHGLGVMGSTGRGIEECFGMTNIVDISFGSLAKGLSAAGGYVAASYKIISALRFTSSVGFSGTLPPLECARGIVILKRTTSYGHKQRVAHVKSMAKYLRSQLRTAGCDLPVNDHEDCCALVCVRIQGCKRMSDAYELLKDMNLRGYSIAVIIGLAVKGCVSRLVAQAWMTKQDIDGFVQVFAECVGSRFGGGVGGFQRVVGYSLGSSDRDHTEVVSIGESKFSVSRIGTNGNARVMDALVDAELRTSKGGACAIGLGGMNVTIGTGWGTYVLHNAMRMFPMISRALRTPSMGWKLCDGVQLQLVLEKKMVKFIPSGWNPPCGLTAYMPEGIGRWGMLRGLLDANYAVSFGDLAVIGVPVNISSITVLELTSRILLPFVTTLLPFNMLYPVLKPRSVKIHEKEKVEKAYAVVEQEQQKLPKCVLDGFANASVIAGDTKVIMECIENGASVADKYVLINTVTEADMKRLFNEFGVAGVVTSTPCVGGRAFGTNVMHAVAIAANGRAMTDNELEKWIEENHIEPSNKQAAMCDCATCQK